MIVRRKRTNRAEWLEWRKPHITGSVTGALFPESDYPYESVFHIYAEKRGTEFPPKQRTDSMRRGDWEEAAIGKAVREKRPHWTVIEADEYIYDDEWNLGCTPDFLIKGDPRGPGVLQAKSVRQKVFEDKWHSGAVVPLWVELQAAVEAMLTDSRFFAVAVMPVHPEADCYIHEFERNPTTELKILAAVKEFWDCVREGREPAPDFAKDTEAIRAMYPTPVPGSVIDLSGDNNLPGLLEERADLAAVSKECETRIDSIDNKLRFVLKDAEVAVLPGWRVTHKLTERQEYTVPAKTYRSLRVYDRREKDA